MATMKGMPASMHIPKTTPAKPKTEAIDRSISPAIISRVIGIDHQGQADRPAAVMAKFGAGGEERES